MTIKEKEELRKVELKKMISKGKAINDFKKSDAYDIIVDWIKKEANYEKILKASKEDRDEITGYVRFGQAFLKQLEVWDKTFNKKVKEFNKLLDKE